MIVDIVLKYSVTPSEVKKIGGFYNTKPTFEDEDITDYNIKELVKKAIEDCANNLKGYTDDSNL